MWFKPNLQFFTLLLASLDLATSSAEKSENLNREAVTKLGPDHQPWPAQLSLSPPSPGRRRDQLQSVGHTYGQRASVVKPANQVQAQGFHSHQQQHQSTALAEQVLNLATSVESRSQPDSFAKSARASHGSSQNPHLFAQESAPSHLTEASFLHKHMGTNFINNEASLAGQPTTLELALRQVSGDESVFQPAPTIVAVGHSSNFDWLTQAPSAKQSGPTHGPGQRQHLSSAAAAPAANLQNQTSHELLAETAVAVAVAGSANKPARNVTNHLEPLILDHHQSGPDSRDSYGEQLQQQQQRQQLGELQAGAQANVSNPIEFNNQVIYEGPVTAPPSREDYHFTNPERLPSSNSIGRNNNNYYNEHANTNAWWAIGTGDEFERVSNLTRANYRDYCDKSPLLIGSRQRSLCRLHPRVMPTVARAIRMAIDECQKRFAFSRWNCSVILGASSASSTDLDTSNYAVSRQQIFGDVMRYPNRERSFLNAISAAALAHSMTKACRQGELPEECGCDRKVRSSHKNRIEWVGCSDDIDYGARFSRDFTDNFDTNEPDATKTIYLHNSEVGRRVFKAITDITCTCMNGENGLCETKRCWKHMGSFSDVVDQIMDRYESATQVQRSNKDPQKLRPVRRGVRKPKRKDLVYIDESPDYCQQDLRIGVLGTHNRMCNSTSQGPDSCSLLCCGRGFQNIVEQVEEDCNCKFVWCCQVKCDKCSRYVTNEICN